MYSCMFLHALFSLCSPVDAAIHWEQIYKVPNKVASESVTTHCFKFWVSCGCARWFFDFL